MTRRCLECWDLNVTVARIGLPPLLPSVFAEDSRPMAFPPDAKCPLGGMLVAMYTDCLPRFW
jgi:hypothetical protein